MSKKLNNVAEMMNLLQEKMKKGRIMTVQICQKMRGMGDVAAKRKRIRPFRILAVLMGAGTLAMLMRFPAKAVSLERQQAQLVEAAQAYGEDRADGDRLLRFYRAYGAQGLRLLLVRRNHLSGGQFGRDRAAA